MCWPVVNMSDQGLEYLWRFQERGMQIPARTVSPYEWLAFTTGLEHRNNDIKLTGSHDSVNLTTADILKRALSITCVLLTQSEVLR
jgi:hypothetical protein